MSTRPGRRIASRLCECVRVTIYQKQQFYFCKRTVLPLMYDALVRTRGKLEVGCQTDFAIITRLGVARNFDWGAQTTKKVFIARSMTFDWGGGGAKCSWRSIWDWGGQTTTYIVKTQTITKTKKGFHGLKSKFCPKNEMKSKKEKKVFTD